MGPKLQLPLLSPTHTERTVGPAGSNATTTAQDGFTSWLIQPKQAVRRNGRAFNTCTTAWSAITVRWAENNLKTISTKSNLQPDKQADPVDLRHQLLLLALGKAKEGQDFLPWWQGRLRLVKAFQGTSLLVCKRSGILLTICWDVKSSLTYVWQ